MQKTHSKKQFLKAIEGKTFKYFRLHVGAISLFATDIIMNELKMADFEYIQYDMQDDECGHEKELTTLIIINTF